jgi:hypothetical protein
VNADRMFDRFAPINVIFPKRVILNKVREPRSSALNPRPYLKYMGPIPMAISLRRPARLARRTGSAQDRLVRAELS